MKELKVLPKYKKEWEKKFTIDPLITNEENGIYLIIKDYDPITHNGIVETKVIRQMNTSDSTHNHHYMFEIFKYIKKFQSYTNHSMSFVYNPNSNSVPNGQWVKVSLPEKDILRAISKHLMGKKIKQNPFYKNLENIKSYNDFIMKIFKNLKRNTEITLVIQKKVGYKYYQVIEYK